MHILQNILFTINVSSETIKQRILMFFAYCPYNTISKILFYSYCIVFIIPFLAMIISECILLSSYFVCFKFISSFPIPILFNIIGLICSFVFICLSYLYYGINIITTALPNFLLAEEKPFTYSQNATDIFSN